MFNVIKGNVINKNVKPITINPNKKRRENQEEIIENPNEEKEFEQEVNNEQVEITMEEKEQLAAPLNKRTTKKNEQEYYTEYFEDEKEKLNKELLEIQNEIDLKKEELSQLDNRIEQMLIEAKQEA